MSNDDATLFDMLKASRLALEFVAGESKPQFLKNTKTQSAVLHQLLILGEGAKKLSTQLRTKHKNIPWKQIAGMRDRIIHQYNDVDLDLVWITLQRELPLLIRLMEGLVSQTPPI